MPHDASSEQSYALRPERRNGFYDRLVKQTYSVLARTPQGDRKWHMSASIPCSSSHRTLTPLSTAAYFIPATVDQLRTVDDDAQLARLHIPDGMYISAKMGKGRAPNYSSVPDGAGSYIVSPEGIPAAYQYPYYQPQPYAQPGAARGLAAPHAFVEQPVDPANRLPPPNLPGTSRPSYTPRHPLDDAALRALRPTFP